ncbi:hypothetical protein Ddye_014583 [Dipteronia dyeriana]|uniref:Receptor-like serine/threonine-protein kinase n=1 Tax=Dipteronia dyeriana TaxID=168575 RepID=A0AAD9X8K1_9ROSI|nr:hypothetical protein Ddye_014583 [Dipteronia dyeriana]
MGCFLFLITFVGTLFFSSTMNLSVDTKSLAQSIRDGETLVSASQSFELGFFTPGNSNNRYIGIWYKFNPSKVVWVANRKNPITDKQGMLVMNDDGNLVLLNKDKKVIWSTNSSRVLENPVAQLLDSGNLVIRDNINMSSDGYVWQSFDYPSDTMLAGMRLGRNLRSGFERYLTPWRSADDPSPGDFSFRLDIQGLPELVITTGSRKEARSGPWDGRQFGGTLFSNKVVHNVIYKPMLVHKQDELYYTFEPFNNTVKTLIVLHQSGTQQRLVWNWKTTEWRILYSWPFDQCDNYAQCGANNNCRINKTPLCECLKGFIPKAEDEWDTQGLSQSRKCIEKSPSDCPSGEGFLKLPAIKLPDFYWSNNSMNIKECEAECFKNCSCRAYANSDVSGGSGCLMWFGDLIDIRVCPPGFSWGQVIFLRVPASELVKHYLNKKKRIKIIAVVSTITGIFILVLVLCTVWQKTKNRGSESREEEEEVPLIDSITISAATNNFSQANMIGKGGFGPVYKGILSTGQEIAVKRLSNDSGQGVEEFKSEVVLIGKLQHRNLAGLLGSCIQGDERMLIYEYMPNKSLDYFIFDDERSKFLSWIKRFDIIIGIARGLLYLHQDSKLQIIHRDLKASNILLDNDLNPKISDFGLARIFRGDDKEANTKRIAGTYGYMSPEYATDGKFSLKSDVFSFGVLLLEIVSGKKNRGFLHPDHHLNLLGHAWVLWNNGRALEVKDVCLEDSIESQVLRCIQVGLLCVQIFPEDRPKMSSVVFMLANEGLLLPQPKQPGFFTERGFIPGSTSSSKEKSHTENAMSITTQDGR